MDKWREHKINKDCFIILDISYYNSDGYYVTRQRRYVSDVIRMGTSGHYNFDYDTNDFELMPRDKAMKIILYLLNHPNKLPKIDKCKPKLMNIYLKRNKEIGQKILCQSVISVSLNIDLY